MTENWTYFEKSWGIQRTNKSKETRWIKKKNWKQDFWTVTETSIHVAEDWVQKI